VPIVPVVVPMSQIAIAVRTAAAPIAAVRGAIGLAAGAVVPSKPGHQAVAKKRGRARNGTPRSRTSGRGNPRARKPIAAGRAFNAAAGRPAWRAAAGAVVAAADADPMPR
jgi:hypothetical protein